MTVVQMFELDKPRPVVISHRVIVQPSVSVTKFKRRRFYVNKSCSTFRESFTIKMSGPPLSESVVKDATVASIAEDLADSHLEQALHPSTKTLSHESFETDNDIVHVNGDDTSSNPETATPVPEPEDPVRGAADTALVRDESPNPAPVPSQKEVDVSDPSDALPKTLLEQLKAPENRCAVAALVLGTGLISGFVYYKLR